MYQMSGSEMKLEKLINPIATHSVYSGNNAVCLLKSLVIAIAVRLKTYIEYRRTISNDSTNVLNQQKLCNCAQVI